VICSIFFAGKSSMIQTVDGHNVSGSFVSVSQLVKVAGVKCVSLLPLVVVVGPVSRVSDAPVVESPNFSKVTRNFYRFCM
jgi:hypothetical protein